MPANGLAGTTGYLPPPQSITAAMHGKNNNKVEKVELTL
jgi:hypothetical protein